MFKKQTLLIICFLNITLAFTQSYSKNRSNFLDSLVVKADYASTQSRFYEVLNIGDLLIDTVSQISDIDSNYYLGNGYSILSEAYLFPDRDQKEGVELLNKASAYNNTVKDPYLGYRIALNKSEMYGIMNELDSAFYYHHQAKRITKEYLPLYYSDALLALSFHHRYIRNPDSSKFYLEKADDFLKDKKDLAKKAAYYFNLAEHFMFFGGGDVEENALKAIDLVPKDRIRELNLYLNFNAHILLNNKKFEKALESKTRYVHNLEDILNNLTNAHITTLEKKKMELEMKTKVESLELERKFVLDKAEERKKWIIIVSLLAMSTLLGLIYFFFSYKKKQILSDKLNIQNKELEEAKNQAIELAQLKSQFSETVSHELRTPLHGVLGLTSILIAEEKENLSEKGKEYLDSLKFSGDYLLNLINDVLQISKVDAKKLTLEHTSFDLKFMIANLSSSFQYLIDKNEVEFQIYVDNTIPIELIGDPIRLSQVIINLVGNALKFTKQGKVTLRLKLNKLTDTNTTILFEVEDTGIGVAKDMQEQIFEKFTQISTDSSSRRGTGLGLSIVKELLKLHNSNIYLESELGKGSKFWFEIDFKHSNTNNSVNNWHKLEIEALDVPKQILIVDDNEINRIVSEKLLKEYNFKITLCENGKQAIDLLQNSSFDIILMDLHMPIMDGKQSVIEFRKVNTKTPVVLLTASNVEDEWVEFKNLGFTDYIIKPYDRYDFLRKILKYV